MRAIEESKAAVCLVTDRFLKSEYIRKKELPALRRQRFRTGLLLVPVLVEPCAWREHDWLSPTQILPRDDRPVCDVFKRREQVFFREVAENLLTRIGKSEHCGRQWTKPDVVDRSRLPRCVASAIGRELDLDELDSAWNSADVNVVSVIGSAGVGKSTLLTAWLDRMADQNYRDARRVFGWSFDGSSIGGMAVCADEFLTVLSKWLGAETTRMQAWERGRLLARLVRESTTLLVLDGIDALQHENGSVAAPIRDPAVAHMLTDLARNNVGLVVTTSRRPLTDLQHFSERVRDLSLEVLTSEAGAMILCDPRIAPHDRVRISEQLSNHAFALALLAADLRHGPLPNATLDKIQSLPASEAIDPSDKALQVLDAIVSSNGIEEQQSLELLALLDGPCDANAVEALRRAAIKDVSDSLPDTSGSAWGVLVERLRQRQLILPPSQHSPQALDVHPLVRAFFGQRACARDACGWRSAHKCLFEHFQSLAPARPGNFEELQPLYRAVRHGCLAGQHQRALDMFYERIFQGPEEFSLRLGLIGPDLLAIGHFFNTRWTVVVDGIAEKDWGFVIGQAGLYLSLSGHLRESMPVFEVGATADEQAGRTKNASVTIGNLGRTMLICGELEQAVRLSRRSIELADATRDASEGVISRTNLALALHMTGNLDEAEEWFREAEARQRAYWGGSFLFGANGVEYGDLLIATGRWSDAQTRANANLKKARNNQSVGGQDRLAAARANLAELKERGQGDPQSTSDHVDAALASLREANQLHSLLKGLLTRAELLRLLYRPHEALEVLDESLDLTLRCGMRLYEVDARTARAQILAELGSRTEATACAAAAIRLARDLDYPGQNRALANLKTRLGLRG